MAVLSVSFAWLPDFVGGGADDMVHSGGSD